jgi:acetylornithine/succinyldiaminopimelate/putrescine aminotransferase
MNGQPTLLDTCEQMIHEQIPNLFRPFANPYVVQTCYCLSELVRMVWPSHQSSAQPLQSFLANSLDEALSGAIKLARYCANAKKTSPKGLVIDPCDRLGPFAEVNIRGHETIRFVRDLTIVKDRRICEFKDHFGFVVIMDTQDQDTTGYLARYLKQGCADPPFIIRAMTQLQLAHIELAARDPVPDIVIFDESFVNHDLPFAAFTARRRLFDAWNRRSKSTFHSTTFQPNTIASMHFLKCLEASEPHFVKSIDDVLMRIQNDVSYCLMMMEKLYSPFLAKAIRSLRLDTPNVTASGHFVRANDRPIFDCVAGVACSIRGHNPPTYVDEISRLESPDNLHETVSARLAELTSLDYLVPAVSGASAVENALRLGLAAQHPKTHVIAFQGGFGGKTLLALTGTAKSTYKENLQPLYENVTYLDPFSQNVIDDLIATLNEYSVAVVQVELIQAVGGLRALPRQLLEYLSANKNKLGYLLFVDEVQTGMYRTGPFCLSKALGLQPDLLTFGKGASDMVIPMAVTLYSDRVREGLVENCPELPSELCERTENKSGYKTLLNALDRIADQGLAARATEIGSTFIRQLNRELRDCQSVHEVRAFGALIAVELAAGQWLDRKLTKLRTGLHIRAMIHDPIFPAFVGYCQYEPNVLKLTPPLTLSDSEIENVCATIGRALRRPFTRSLMAAAVSTLSETLIRRPIPRAPRKDQHEPVAC